MLSEWEIKARSRHCARTQAAFDNGETIYTLLFRDRDGFRREDISEKAWQQSKESVAPFSFWKSKFQSISLPTPEPVPKESAEGLLRRLVKEDLPEQLNARYVLAILLERKRTLKQVDVRENVEEKILIYEHVKTGEAFIIPDPQLRLDQLDSVQQEIYSLLARESASESDIASRSGSN